ncbi:MAG TPA: DUF928 domain-containing protein [Nitrospira sp.]|nr:DUF928 domain-containing protein [Nitrospira sp.]
MIGRTKTPFVLLTGLLLGSPLAGIAGEPSSAKPLLVADAKDAQAVKAIAYQPPRKGAPAPGLRRGGGTRGMNQSVPVISLLAPEHVGLTVSEQPVLYWFTPTRQDQTFEFTLIGETAEAPAVETKLSSPTQPGIHQIKLSDYKVKLSPGERYNWSVALIVDAEERSANIVAKGAIERIERNKLEQPLPATINDADAPKQYAEAGIWYDAVMAISNQIQSNPADADLRQMRASLLQQAGLTEVAESDLKARAK